MDRKSKRSAGACAVKNSLKYPVKYPVKYAVENVLPTRFVLRTLATSLLALLSSSHSPAMADSGSQRPPSNLVAPPPAQYVTNYRYGNQPAPGPAGGFSSPATRSAATPGGDDAVLQANAKPIVSTLFNQYQTFTDSITIKPEQDKESLTLIFTNGDGGPAFQDVQISLNGRRVGSSQSFSNGKFLLPVSGALRNGTNQLTILALGPIGAKITWKLSESKLQVTSVSPNSFALDEKKITIAGRGFPTAPAAVKVTIGGVQADVSASTPILITLRTPLRDNTPGGRQDLIVTVGGKKSAPIKVKVKLTPIVLSCDFVATAPGQPITVYGKNFSKVASENVVTLGGESCSVVSATDTSLVVTVSPTLGATFPVWDAVIKVTTDGVESKGTDVKINIGQRVIENQGTPQY